MKKLILLFLVLVVAVAAAYAVFQTAEQVQAAAISSAGSGNWSNASTWNGGRVPGAGDSVTISGGHTVTYDVTDSQVSGVTIIGNGRLVFASGKSVVLRTDRNIEVLGRLEMKPSSASIQHTIRFVGIDETRMVGGGMNTLASDVGLWVMGAGSLDIAGSAKTAWTRLQGGANAGSNTIQLQQAPNGWRVGDEIVVVPTEPTSAGDASWNGFELRTIASISGSTITLNSGLSRNHPVATDPKTNRAFTAEVLNLSRNVRIEGTGNGSANPNQNGRAHILIRSTAPQFVKYAELKLLGPRRFTGESNFTAGVLGRYGLHFHHSENGSIGSLVEGTVVRDTGGHAFAPHASDGIIFRNTISYNTFDDAYWWDPPPQLPGRPGVNSTNPINDSDDILYDNAVAALTKFDPAFRGSRLSGFWLGPGLRNAVRNSVAVGIQGGNVGVSDSSGFIWPEAGSDRGGAPSGVWGFNQGNISHNNKNHGIFTWQNTSHLHIVSNVALYNNANSAVDHGAYVNSYRYVDVIAFGNGKYGLQVHSAARNVQLRPDGYSQSFERFHTTKPIIFPNHNSLTGIPTLLKDCTFTGVVVNDARTDQNFPTEADFCNCAKPNGQSIEPADFTFQNVEPGLDIRVERPNGTAYHITNGGVVTNIAPFCSSFSLPPVGPTQPTQQPPTQQPQTQQPSTQQPSTQQPSTQQPGQSGGQSSQPAAAAPAVCGDGKIEGSEKCEPGNLAGQTCQTGGYTQGTLACHPAGSAQQCQYDVSGCSGIAGLVPCGQLGNPCNLCHIFKLVNNVLVFLLIPDGSVNNFIPLVLVIAGLLIALGGFFMMTSAGNLANLARGRTIIFAVVVGLLIMYGAWLFIGFLLQAVGFVSFNGGLPWNEISCGN